MMKTRASLYYVVFYLSTTGLALLVAPLEVLRFLGATGHYEPIMTRTVGTFMVALSILVLQIVRHRVVVLYPTTLGVRGFFLASFLWLYAQSRDPLLLVMLGVVGLGVFLTGLAYLYERGTATRDQASTSPN